MKSFLGACAAAYRKLHLFDSRCARIDECIDEKEPEKAGSSTPGSFDSRGRVSSLFLGSFLFVVPSLHFFFLLLEKKKKSTKTRHPVRRRQALAYLAVEKP